MGRRRCCCQCPCPYCKGNTVKTPPYNNDKEYEKCVPDQLQVTLAGLGNASHVDILDPSNPSICYCSRFNGTWFVDSEVCFNYPYAFTPDFCSYAESGSGTAEFPESGDCYWQSPITHGDCDFLNPDIYLCYPGYCWGVHIIIDIDKAPFPTASANGGCSLPPTGVSGPPWPSGFTIPWLGTQYPEDHIIIRGALFFVVNNVAIVGGGTFIHFYYVYEYDTGIKNRIDCYGDISNVALTYKGMYEYWGIGPPRIVLSGNTCDPPEKWVCDPTGSTMTVSSVRSVHVDH